jgi:aminoglycoside phosphotransferase (APT) family kinase protein
VREVTLNEAQANEVVRRAGGDGPVRLTPIAERNHVWRLQHGPDASFLKVYTKDWYGDDPTGTGFCVAHEVAGWAALRRAGLAVPAVALADEGCDNPLGRPYLLTRELRGESLTAILARERSLDPLRAVGRYLDRAHTITFPHPGYLTSTGPNEPLRAGSWQHRCWSAEQRQRDALATLDRTRDRLTPAVAARLEATLAHLATALAPAYRPPRFVHGDCHAHQFFLSHQDGEWAVSGVLDLEVSSAGDSGEDFLQRCTELATVLDPATRWWEAFFAGYGSVPSFDLLRLRFLGTTPEAYAWLAGRGWPETWQGLVEHSLRAQGWRELLTLPGRHVPGGLAPR